MPTPVAFMRQYRDLKAIAGIEDDAAKMTRLVTHRVQLRKYFMMDWADGTEERRDYNTVTRGSKHDTWFNANKARIRNAAMGKGAPQDYELALEWAVRSGKIANIDQSTLQTFCDNHLGIDCSGFATNYLIACGKKAYSSQTVRNTGAASYYNSANAVNNSSKIRQGDLLGTLPLDLRQLGTLAGMGKAEFRSVVHPIFLESVLFTLFENEPVHGELLIRPPELPAELLGCVALL